MCLGNLFSLAHSCLYVWTFYYSNVRRFAVSHAPSHNQDVHLSVIVAPDNHGEKREPRESSFLTMPVQVFATAPRSSIT